MKIETQLRDDHQATIIAEIEPDVLEKFKRQAARKISQETKIPGFRPGKAPYDVIRRMFGDDAIEKEAISLLVDDTYPKALEQAEVKPYGPGSLEDIPNRDPLTFQFLVPLAPQAELGAYLDIRKDYAPEDITDEEVNQYIDQIRSSSGTLVPVERPAEEGDIVSFSISGKRVNPAEGEDEILVKERPYQSMIRSADDTMPNEWPYSGFNRELIGLGADDTKEITYTFDENSSYEALRNKEVVFSISVKSVKKLELPELSLEFVQTVGEFESVEQFQHDIRESLDHQKKDQYEAEYLSDLMDQIVEMSTFKYPPQALEDETEQVLNSLQGDLAQQNLDLDTYLKIRKTDKETFINEEIKPAAIKRLQRSLVMDELTDKEQIKFDNNSFQSAFGEAMYEAQVDPSFKEVRKKMSDKEIANAIAMQAASRVINRQVFERLKLIATNQPIPSEEEGTALEEESKPADGTDAEE